MQIKLILFEWFVPYFQRSAVFNRRIKGFQQISHLFEMGNFCYTENGADGVPARKPSSLITEYNIIQNCAVQS